MRMGGWRQKEAVGKAGIRMRQRHTRCGRVFVSVALVTVLASSAIAWATPEFVEHIPANAVYGEGTGVTMRAPVNPGAGAGIDVWVRIGYSFYYTDVALYYTIDGSTPAGSFGTPSGTTSVLRSGAAISFIRNEPHSPNNIDWWKVTLPANCATAGATVKYQISAWHNGGGPEIFANNYGCADGTCDNPAAPATVFQYTVPGGGATLPWPGKGAPYADHAVGYPPVSLWKEEGVVGNNYMNVQLDQNGTIYDVYYPSAGCVNGMGTKNEGYVDGLDTFPAGLPLGSRGQMNMNQAMGGLRVDGVTYWLSNENASGYSAVSQQYVVDTNVIATTATLTANGNSILVSQYDFCPKGITFPTDQGNQPNRGMYLKRYLLRNNGATTKTVQFYFYMDPALNGGDGYDAMYADAARGALIAYDNTQRYTSASGEYNPTTTGDYNKNVSIYLAAALKAVDTVGGAGGTAATGSWRANGSTDNGQGWIGLEIALPVNVTKEIDLALVGGFDTFAGATGTYDYQIAPVLDAFLAANVSTWQATTQDWWTHWLASGLTVDTPDSRIDELYRRGLLATALHLDGKNGGVVAGMHNGAYPFVWPRDAVWAAMTLDRTGHSGEGAEVYRFLRDTAYRANDTWGKGFWYQKYTTDGYIVWNSPQVDETSAAPWGVYYHYLVTGDTSFLNAYYTMTYDAARASSEDSSIDGRLYYDDAYQLMHANNLWEDSWDDFIYSNASVERGLRDAASIATLLGHPSDATLFTNRANAIHAGITGRLNWDGENTDISLLGPAYPFNVYSAKDPLIAHCVDRMNGVATDRNGNNHPIMRFSGEWQGLVDRYWADTYWNGGPWFLSTMWYGCYYAQRQDLNPGKGDIDNHLSRLDLLIDRLGPVGLGAEQIAPSNSLAYPDFVLQAAWPNAWESMSFFVDSVMLFLGYTPDAPGNTLRIAPKLPTGWTTMSFHGVPVGAHRIDVHCLEQPTMTTQVFTNVTGNAVAYDTYIRVNAGCEALAVMQDAAPVPFTYDAATGRVHVTGSLHTGANAVTMVNVSLCTPGDLNCSCAIGSDDLAAFQTAMAGPGNPRPAACDPDLFDRADLDHDSDVDLADFAGLQWLVQ
jgi:GH15 family glucan-1,4-alpha-glucosidase